MHEAGFIHNDISPHCLGIKEIQNLADFDSVEVVITMFGLASKYDPKKP